MHTTPLMMHLIEPSSVPGLWAQALHPQLNEEALGIRSEAGSSQHHDALQTLDSKAHLEEEACQQLTHVANTSAAIAAGLYAFAVQMTICHPLVTRGAARCRWAPGQAPGGFTRLALGRRGAALPLVRGRAAPTVPARQ